MICTRYFCRPVPRCLGHTRPSSSSSSSSSHWRMRQSSDIFAKTAAIQNYRSRAAFKLTEIDDKYRLIKKKVERIVDLGAAPGSWSQVAVERVQTPGTGVLSVDTSTFTPVPGTLHLDNTSAEDYAAISAAMRTIWGDGKAQLVLSDMLHAVSGARDYDHVSSVQLCSVVLKFCFLNLENRGSVVMKIYHGVHCEQFMLLMEKYFRSVTICKPAASRAASRERYIVGVGFRRSAVKRSVVKQGEEEFVD